MLTKIYEFVKKYWFWGLFLILLLSFSFSLGIIVGGKLFQRPPIVIEKDLLLNLKEISLENDRNSSTQYVASSKGKYYYPVDCPLAKNLSEKNKIYFKSKEEAESQGYIYNSKCDNY